MDVLCVLEVYTSNGKISDVNNTLFAAVKKKPKLTCKNRQVVI